MRILHVYKLFELFTKGGGVERYIHCLANQQTRMGYDLGVVAPKTDPAGTETPENLEVLYSVTEGGLAALWREIGKADVVHIHGPRMIYSAIGGLFAWVRGKKLAYTVHCFYSGKTPFQRFIRIVWDQIAERFLFSTARCVIVLSDFWLGEVKARGLPAKNCVVAPNGVNVDALAKPRQTREGLAGAPAILLVGRLDPVKRIEDLIRVLDQPGLENAQAYIVGRGADEARLKAIAAEKSSVLSRVHFCGFLDDDEVASLAYRADVFALPSSEEGMPTTFLEMLARGLPVVGSDNPGNAAIAKALDWKYIHRIGDVEEMGRQILDASNADVPDEIFHKLKEVFDWHAIAAQILRAYKIS